MSRKKILEAESKNGKIKDKPKVRILTFKDLKDAREYLESIDEPIDSSFYQVKEDIAGGKPCFSGTRLALCFFIDYILSGGTVDEFCIDYPFVEKDKVIRFLQYIKKLINENRKIKKR